MSDSTLIVARMKPDSASAVSELFSESDATGLPRALGVRRRHLFHYGPLYFHFVEFDGSQKEPMRVAGARPDFRLLCARLAHFVTPYDPATWHSPADAMATEFYSWTGR